MWGRRPQGCPGRWGAAHFLRETVGRVRYAGARGQLTVRADSGFYTHAMSPPAAGWMSASPSPSARVLACAVSSRPYPSRTGRIPYWMEGAADVYTPFQSKPDAAPVRLIVRRVQPTPGSQLAPPTAITASLAVGVPRPQVRRGVDHLPSGRFPANGAWLAVQVIAHNLARWTARIGLGEQIVTTKTLRRRFFSMAGRLTRSARRLTLHLPQRWPWEAQFSGALARFRALPLPS